MWEILTEVLACPEMQFSEACLAMAAALFGLYKAGAWLLTMDDDCFTTRRERAMKPAVRRAIRRCCIAALPVCILAFPAAMVWAFKAYATVCSY